MLTYEGTRGNVDKIEAGNRAPYIHTAYLIPINTIYVPYILCQQRDEQSLTCAVYWQQMRMGSLDVCLHLCHGVWSCPRTLCVAPLRPPSASSLPR